VIVVAEASEILKVMSVGKRAIVFALRDVFDDDST